jgi:hypothetical protein
MGFGLARESEQIALGALWGLWFGPVREREHISPCRRNQFGSLRAKRIL